MPRTMAVRISLDWAARNRGSYRREDILVMKITDVHCYTGIIMVGIRHKLSTCVGLQNNVC